MQPFENNLQFSHPTNYWPESRYKPGMKAEDAKRLVRDAIAARLFNDMLMQSGNSRKILDTRVQPCLWVGGGGLGMYDCEEIPTNASVTQDFCP